MAVSLKVLLFFLEYEYSESNWIVKLRIAPNLYQRLQFSTLFSVEDSQLEGSFTTRARKN